jgi:omega-hydroxy-beta-dihydromenaquinone-9 sulfotransferase
MSRFLPSVLSGMATGEWLRVLRQNRFAIDRPFWFRAAVVTASAPYNSVAKAVEGLIYGRRVRRAEVREPVFVIGHWRTGTTHLHNLLSTDPRFAYPNYMDVFAPHSLFWPPVLAKWLLKLLLPKSRPMDNMKLDLNLPQEDEFGLAVLTGLSPYLALMFLRNHERYKPYLTFRDAPPGDADRWKAAVKRYYQALTVKYGGKTLLLKSPPHTARVGLLLDLFPDAKFVHIIREPYTVFASSKHLYLKLGKLLQFQREPADADQQVVRPIIEAYKEMYDALFEDVKRVRPGHYHEVRFEELEKDPLGQMRQAYERLSLSDFSAAEGPMRQYVAGLGEYKKNAYKPLPEPLRQEVAEAWRPFFEAWNYPIEPSPSS